MNLYQSNSNAFIGYYVNDYNEVLNTPAPIDGTSILFANLDQGILWSKKMIAGQAYIQSYKIEPINNMGTPKQPEDKLDLILKRLDKLESKAQEDKDNGHE